MLLNHSHSNDTLFTNKQIHTYFASIMETNDKLSSIIERNDKLSALFARWLHINRQHVTILYIKIRNPSRATNFERYIF